ncbi:conserved Plasmodium protein, unknown function [Plasmodium gallinaceum]|uniref:Proteasome activator complex subunit 4 C-terminal domain-containing protein n=1 Tax=Plasmodium gallinaceum TaxID=5849 RepID=A0A1J1GYY3_PLAGA|nr:conserved Plasmodium protein, unknown function [Plasmodium gallinaceum]CRG97664.1 conserved Plasmodium protein, unknown function [Plasmodium gallinaceum]
MLNIFRELNDYSNFLPKKIKENVNKEKYELLSEIKRRVLLKKNNSYNVTTVIKLFNSYETINTRKHKSFYYYIFMIRYLWKSLQNKNLSPNLKSYICQSLSNILKNIKKYILDDFFFEHDRNLIMKDKEIVNYDEVESDFTNNSYADISDHYYLEYKKVDEDSEVESIINENSVQNLNDFYLSFNGIFEKNEEYGSFFNEEIIINGKDESFRLYIQKCILNIIDYEYIFNLVYDYLSNNTTKNDEYSHNSYKNYINSLLNVLISLKSFCYYNIDVHNLLVDFSLNNIHSIKYEEYVDKKGECFYENNYFDKDSIIFVINDKLNEKVNKSIGNNDDVNNNDINTTLKKNEKINSNIDKSVCIIDNLELCTRYNTIFLNFVLLCQLGSDDLCFKLIKYNKLLYLYNKIKKFNWHCINYSFVKIIYKGLKYAYVYNISLKKEINEMLNIIFFLFMYYIKLPNNVQLNSSKYFIPDEYNLLINDNESVIKVISKIFVFLLNKNYRNNEENISNKEKDQKLLDKFLSYIDEKNFNLNDFDENKNLFSIFENVDTYGYINIITSLFIPHIHPCNIGKHIGNINLFINSFLYCFIRKMKREEIFLKKKEVKTSEKLNDHKIDNDIDNYINNYFITEGDKKFIVEKFTTLVLQGMFPKNNKGISLFENILKHICIIDINCLDIFVKKIMDCLCNVNISTQICNCLLSLCLLLPLLVKYKSTYLKDILYVMNVGIDICDVYKSFTIFSFLSILFSYISIVKIDNIDYSLAVNEYKKFIHFENIQKELNDEEVKNIIVQRKELIDYLCQWVYEFFDKILYFIKFSKSEKNKDNKKQNGEIKDSKIENDLYTGLKTTIISLFIHLDHQIIYELCQRFLNNIELENSKFLSIIPYAIGLVNNKKIFDMLFNTFYKKLVTKRKKKKKSDNECNDEKETEQEVESYVYTKNEYANDDTIKCYLLFLSNLIRRAKNEFLNLEDIYNLIEIYIVEDNNTIFKYICKIIYRFLEYNFSLTIKDYSCFKIDENMTYTDKILTFAYWGIPWHILSNQNKLNENNLLKMDKNEKINTNDENYFSNIDELIKWKSPSLEDIKVGKNFIFLLLDYLIDLLMQCEIPICTPNLIKYIKKRNIKETRIKWKFTLNYSNIISRFYKVIKVIIKPLSLLYPDERYNYNNLLAKCHVINTKLSFYLYVYISEIIITLSLHVLKIPKQIIDISPYIEYNSNDEKLENKSSFSSLNSENSINEINRNSYDKQEIKKMKEDFFNNVINNREKDIKADAKIQRKIIKNIHLLLLKCNENSNSSLYNEYINNVLSFTYNMYPNSYNFDIIKNQYINNIFFLFNERLKQRKKNYCFQGYRKQLCNILFFINLSIYSQVRSYAQTTIKLILPSFKIIKVPFLKICSFYLKNYIKLYILTQKDKKENKESLKENNDNIEIDDNDNVRKLSTLKSFSDLNANDYFENKCISCFNGVILNITNSMGLIKKIITDIHLLKKFIKIIINILRLDIQKEEITLKCMKLVYALINNRFFKNSVDEKKKKKKINYLFLFLKEESEKKNNVYVQIVILSFLICFNNFVIENNSEFYFNYLIENLSIKKNVHVYNLAFYGFIKLLKYYNNLKLNIPIHILKYFEKGTIYQNFIEICIYKNLKSKKKNNSINAIIINLSKVQKSFKGFTQISEVHLKDFYCYYIFFKFLVNLQNNYIKENTPIENEKCEKDININQIDSIDHFSSDTNINDISISNYKYKYVGIILFILNKLQKDEHSDNEFKSTFIAVICPLLLSLRKLKNKEEINKILNDIIELLEKEIAIVNSEVFSIWIYYFHLLFINIKKKYIHIYNKLIEFCLCCNFHDVSNLIFKKKMQLLNIILLYSMHKDMHLLDNNLKDFLKLIDNDNITVRQRIGDILCNILYVSYDHKHYDHLKYIYYNVLFYLYNISKGVIEYLVNNENLSKQSKYIYALETLIYLTITMYTNKCIYVLSNLGIIFLKMFILSVKLIDNYINELINKSIKCFLCPSLYLFKLSNINYESIKDHGVKLFADQDLCNLDLLLKDEIGNLLIRELSSLLNNSNWKVRNSTLQFCYLFHSYYCLFIYSKKEHSFMLNIFISLLVDNYVEIQNLSRDILASVFFYYDSIVLQKFSNFFLTIINQKNILMDTSQNNTTKIIEKRKTVAIFALISIVNSFPNYIPLWLPNILVSVAKVSNNTVHSIKKEIEKCIQNFLRTHKDEWEYKYKLIFTEDQLNILDMYKGGLNYFT